MVNYVLAAVIAVAVAGLVAAVMVHRAREKHRMPSLNSIRDVSKRGVQRGTVRARADAGSQDALNGMLSDLKTH